MDPAIKQMNVSLLRYFHAERRAGALFVLIGAAALALALWFALGEQPLRAARWPLAAIGLGQVLVGATVSLRTEGRIARLLGRLNSDAKAYRAMEAPRMKSVMRSFQVLRWTEIALAALGFALVTFGDRWAPWAAGAGWGLLVQSIVTLALDTFAERRGADYLDAIRRNLGG